MDFMGYLNSLGLDEELVFLLLILPFVAFLVGLFRQIIGIKTFGIYEPIVLSFALYAISSDFLWGLAFGLPILVATYLIGELARQLLKKSRLHYVSRVSLKISLASLFILGFLVLAGIFNQKEFLATNPLSIVIIITLVEAVSLFQIKKGETHTNLVSLETLIVTLASYFLITDNWIRSFVIAQPYIVIIPLLGNLIVGRWTGFRLSEYIRFRSILKNE